MYTATAFIVIFSLLHTSIGECPSEWFDCGNGTCLPDSSRCDGTMDCEDGVDEVACGTTINPLQLMSTNVCPHGYFACANTDICITPEYICNGHADCPFKDDEAICNVKTSEQMMDGSNVNETTCPGGFMCLSSECIASSSVCDGHEDCCDGSDESICPSQDQPQGDSPCTWEDGHFLCESGECISLNHVCNGHVECKSGDDEGMFCPTEPPRRPRAVNCTMQANCSQDCADDKANCTCPSGYMLSSDGVKCQDINECFQQPGSLCSHICINTHGSYICACSKGYILLPADNRTCTIDPNSMVADQIAWIKFVTIIIAILVGVVIIVMCLFMAFSK